MLLLQQGISDDRSGHRVAGDDFLFHLQYSGLDVLDHDDHDRCA
jgi:hypothetical protein